jgi:starvation-inducible DNA-binding protein
MDGDVTDKNRLSVVEGLARLLADTYALYIRTQNFHWNVVGPEFYSLHLLFEHQYKELAEAIDEIAERVRALGLYVDASFVGFKRLTAIEDEEKVLTSKEMLHHLFRAHEVVIRHARDLCYSADRARDAATVDLMGRRLNAHEKMAWMLKSQL